MAGHNWLPEQKEIIRSGWEAGKSSIQIADGLGQWCTKGMVIGMVRRMNLPLRDSPIVSRGGRPKGAAGPIIPWRRGHQWTEADILLLREECKTANSWEYIAARFNVTAHAAQNKALKLGIRKPAMLHMRKSKKMAPKKPKSLGKGVSKPAYDHCQFITTHEPPWLWCDALPETRTDHVGRVITSSYCRKHYAVCYQAYHGNGDLTGWLRGKV